jgi:hypothetical protein
VTAWKYAKTSPWTLAVASRQHAVSYFLFTPGNF